MRCEEVQPMIWAGEQSIEMALHIQSCPACQREMGTMKHLVQNLSALEIPMPSRKLTPNADVVRHTVRLNRNRRRLRFAATAASVVLMLGTGVFSANHLIAPQPKSSAEVPLTNPPLSAAPAQTMNEFSITVADTFTDQDLAEATVDYLKRQVDAAQVKGITLVRFLPDPRGGSNDGKQHIFGELEMQVDLREPATAVTPFRQGAQKGHIMFFSNQGSPWKVHYLEQAFRLPSPADTINLWATAQMRRDASSTLLTLKPSLRETVRDTYRQQFWMLSTASPNIDDYVIIRSTQDGASASYEVHLLLRDGREQKVNLLLNRQDGNWFISGIVHQ